LPGDHHEETGDAGQQPVSAQEPIAGRQPFAGPQSIQFHDATSSSSMGDPHLLQNL